MTSEVQEKFISLWGGLISNAQKPKFHLSQPPTALATLFSSRNLALLKQSSNSNLTWDKFEHLIGRLLKSGLILPINLEEQCLIVLKKDWPEDTLRRLGSCLNGVIDSWRKTNIKTNHDSADLLNFTDEFLEWFAWIFSNMANGDLDDSLENFPELSF